MESLFRNGPVLEMIDAFGKVVNQLGIDFFLVGALARDMRLNGDSKLASKRATKDVDIAILLASGRRTDKHRRTCHSNMPPGGYCTLKDHRQCR